MELEEIYQPIAEELSLVEDSLRSVLSDSENGSVAAMSDIALASGGKRLRPALVVFSEKAAGAGSGSGRNGRDTIDIATAVELIHMASLIHDDVLDGASTRHNKPTVNAQYGDDVSIVLGDYIYAKAFQLISKAGNRGVFSCISGAIHAMCEGELIQICQRRNLGLSAEKYISIIEKKTGSLFAACCQAGTIIADVKPVVQKALSSFGLNFGIAFQLADDCRDVVSESAELGKEPGQDVICGDVTLPLLALSDCVGPNERAEIENMLGSMKDGASFERLRTMLVESDALSKTRDVVGSYLCNAKKSLDSLGDSVYKESLGQLLDYTSENSV
ncbi:MAG: polyprenyl synthetase family protein [Sedimentisphaerales bacterium]|nr:polyprenyl synthetase family protein [Sedimentisphaerales bacterium]